MTIGERLTFVNAVEDVDQGITAAGTAAAAALNVKRSRMIFRPLCNRSDDGGIERLAEVLATVLGVEASPLTPSGFEVEDLVEEVNITGWKWNNSSAALLLNWGSQNEGRGEKES